MTRARPVSVLMYHEVSGEMLDGKATHHLTPAYNLSAAMFTEQVRDLARAGFSALGLSNLDHLDPAAKNIMITFDDGLVGNHEHALPILKEFGFRAVFFVAVSAVGKHHYMSWAQLRELCRSGMDVQSHTVSHRPLHMLSPDEVRMELLDSKLRLEDELQSPVTALSFPHGSFNELVVRIAAEIGYRTLYTSEAECNPISAFARSPRILNRIAVTSKFSAQRLLRCAECEFPEILRQRLVKQSKNLVKRIVGIENYRRMYRKFFNISSTLQ